MDIINSIIDIIGNDNDTIWATGDVSYSKFKNDYPRAIILAQKYNRFITNNDYVEQIYHSLMIEIKRTIDKKINLLKQLFDQYGINNYIPPLSQIDEISLIAPFSFKYAAVQAGLGWIGKSGVLVTREFGPRVRLAAILVDYPLECGKPLNKSFCGNCHACVDACPWGFIKGNEWNINMKRDELLDYQSCNKKRSEYIHVYGRKHTCGYCILECPWGTKTEQ